MKIGFVRHAEPFQVRLERGGLNPGLTKTGDEQAYELGKSGKLAGFKWIFTSGALRAFLTALILGNCLHLTPIVAHNLGFVRLDRRLIGDLAMAIQNTPFTQWPELWTKTRWGGLETPEAYVERVRTALQRIIRHTGGEDVLIVAHEETFWAIMAIIEKITIEEAIAKKHIGHAELYVFELKESI